KLFEILATDKFHDQKHAPAIFEDGIPTWYVRNLCIDEKLSFKFKLFAHARVVIQHLLDGSLVTKVHISGAIDTGIAATADHVFDAIAFCEYRAGLERRSGHCGLRH